MTKQHFIRAAEIVNCIRQGNWTDDLPSWARPLTYTEGHEHHCLRAIQTAEMLIAFFSAANPRFDTRRFLVACGLVDTPPAKVKQARTSCPATDWTRNWF